MTDPNLSDDYDEGIPTPDVDDDNADDDAWAPAEFRGDERGDQ